VVKPNPKLGIAVHAAEGQHAWSRSKENANINKKMHSIQPIGETRMTCYTKAERKVEENLKFGVSPFSPFQLSFTCLLLVCLPCSA